MLRTQSSSFASSAVGFLSTVLIHPGRPAGMVILSISLKFAFYGRAADLVDIDTLNLISYARRNQQINNAVLVHVCLNPDFPDHVSPSIFVYFLS